MFSLKPSSLYAKLQTHHITTAGMRPALNLQMIQPRHVLPEHKARAAPSEHAGSARREAVEYTERPIALSIGVYGLGHGVAVSSCASSNRHLGSGLRLRGIDAGRARSTRSTRLLGIGLLRVALWGESALRVLGCALDDGAWLRFTC